MCNYYRNIGQSRKPESGRIQARLVASSGPWEGATICKRVPLLAPDTMQANSQAYFTKYNEM